MCVGDFDVAYIQYRHFDERDLRLALTRDKSRPHVIVKFRLIRRDGAWERKWTYTDPGDSVLNAITAGTHHVAIMPLVGDLSEFVREGLGGGIIVDAPASGAIASVRELERERFPLRPSKGSRR